MAKKKHPKTLKVQSFWEYDKDIPIASQDGKFFFKVDYDDVNHKIVKQRIKELIKVYNDSLEVKDEAGN